MTILFIHQSAELYGSDKTLYLLVVHFRQRGIRPIVVLPQQGPLEALLKAEGIDVIIAPVFKLSRKMFTLKNLLSLPAQALSSMRLIEKETKGSTIDLVYSNTLAVLIGLFYARKKKLKHIWHIHEIIERPTFVQKAYRRLIALKTNSRLIFNSKATQQFWQPAPSAKGVVVWNGLSKPGYAFTEQDKTELRASFGAAPSDIVITLVGRINRQKGHQLLLSAFSPLVKKYPFLKLLYVGSTPPNQEIFLHQLEEKIREHGLGGSVTILPFRENIWPLWESIDIAVVPSTEPESFGLVALEAMLCKKPVVAAGHGGICEIVEHNRTGLLFEPGHALQLQEALECLILDERKRRQFGENGFQRAGTVFTLDHYIQRTEAACLNTLKEQL